MTALPADVEVVLVLSGGNALGAFQAGVYEALHENGVRPGWCVGTSVGALNAALLLGTEPDDRIAALRRFWRADAVGPLDMVHRWLPDAVETGRRSAAATWTAAAGRPGVFGPLLSALARWPDDRPYLYETDQLVATLERMIDIDRLNDGRYRLSVTAVDMESGAVVVFDTARQRVEPRHLRASAALPVLFPPVEIDGRWLVDGGLSANLPIDPVLADPPARPTLCIAVDLLPLAGAVPRTLGEAASRAQDLAFAAQSRRSIERWQAAYRDRRDRSVSLVRLAYAEQGDEVAGKALDFSGPTLAARWAAGRDAGLRLIDRLATLSLGEPGLTCTELG